MEKWGGTGGWVGRCIRCSGICSVRKGWEGKEKTNHKNTVERRMYRAQSWTRKGINGVGIKRGKKNKRYRRGY